MPLPLDEQSVRRESLRSARRPSSFRPLWSLLLLGWSVTLVQILCMCTIRSVTYASDSRPYIGRSAWTPCTTKGYVVQMGLSNLALPD